MKLPYGASHPLCRKIYNDTMVIDGFMDVTLTSPWNSGAWPLSWWRRCPPASEGTSASWWRPSFGPSPHHTASTHTYFIYNISFVYIHTLWIHENKWKWNGCVVRTWYGVNISTRCYGKYHSFGDFLLFLSVNGEIHSTVVFLKSQFSTAVCHNHGVERTSYYISAEFHCFIPQNTIRIQYLTSIYSNRPWYKIINYNQDISCILQGKISSSSGGI